MTKVIIIGEQPAKKELKPIEFRFSINCQKGLNNVTSQPKEFNYIELIAKHYTNDLLDLMFAYRDNRDEGVLIYGHFNDGVV